MLNSLLRPAAELCLLLGGYWVVDRGVRLGGLSRGLRALGVQRQSAAALVWSGLSAVTAPWLPWRALPTGAALGLLSFVLAIGLCWRAATRDIDVVGGEAHGFTRVLLLLNALGCAYSPTLLLSTCLLLSSPFGMWQHHATLPMRVLQALLAFAGLNRALASTALLANAASLWQLVVIIQLSHYLITALAKGYLGPHWYSWVLDNKLHHMAASAYSWGWARFVPWQRWLRVVGAARRLERPLQLAVFALELLSPLALLHPWAAVGFSLGWTGFHVGVFALSGLLFWEWIVTDLALAFTLTTLDAATLNATFGAFPCVLGLLVLAAFPLRHKLWKPMPLGWWDTPFTQRMHWRVRGESGASYGLYANFMDPHERIYGKVHGCFLAPVPVLTYHLGEAWRHELRDGLRAADADPHRIDRLREEFGVEPRSEVLADGHRAYLERFCWELNRGARKHVLPHSLRWLKAPGGQCYYWGELPAYRRQEPITDLEVVYREEFFDGQSLCRMRDEVVLHIVVASGDCVPPAATEPTPKQLDDLLLSVAAGRLIRLPGLGDGFVGGDDGKRPEWA